MSIFDKDLVITELMGIYHLCYVYIPEYKGIKDIEIAVDPHYHCHFDRDDKRLFIDASDRIPDGFWGNGIYSLAAIVGNNGVGKSTAVEFILHAIVDGANTKEIDGILVYEQDSKLFVYSHQVIEIPKDVKLLSIPGKICCLYYSGHFIPNLSLHNLRCGELAGNYNISDGYLLMKDVQNYSNTDYLHSKLSFGEHLSQYNAQNNIRICKMLANKSLYERIKAFCVPKYILFTLNYNGSFALKEFKELTHSGEREKDEIPNILLKHNDKRERLLTSHIYFNFLNLIFNGSHRDVNEEVLECLRNWHVFFNGEKPVLEQFEEFIRTREANPFISERLTSIYRVLNQLDMLATYDWQLIENGRYYLEVSKDYEKIAALVDEMEKSSYLTAQFFDISYAQDLFRDTVLSSGEQKLLDLFSRLYGAIQKDIAKFRNLKAPALIILDEAEQAFHPEWQRRYIRLLLSFLQQMMVVPGLKFQILLTTHSPVLLSDIPNDCITFLKKENDVAHNVFPDNGGTFAANVFDLYRNSFFLENGMVGEFAASKLSDIESRVTQASTMGRDGFRDLLREINLIGDYRIRDYLLTLLPYDKNKEERAFLLERLRYLDNKESDEQN